jgi:hypothetical protein
MERKLTTIIAKDVVGYSRLMEIDEQGTFDRLKDARSNIIDPAIALRVIRIFVPLPQHERTLIARSVRIRADQITVRSAPKIA